MSYPESSCICSECPRINGFKEALPANLNQTNLITPNCKLSGLFNCVNTQTYFNKNEPKVKMYDIPDKFGGKLNDNTGSQIKHTIRTIPNEFPKGPVKHNINILNKNFGLKRADDFQPINCDNYPRAKPSKNFVELNNNSTNGCSSPLYFSYDPRLKNELRPIPLLLDKPPYHGDVRWENVYNDDLYKYGQNYKNYEDIHAGQIQYYVDKDLAPVLFGPNFTIKSNVNGQIFKDPMGAVKFASTREPLLINGSNISEYQSIRDEMEYRENLMHSQMAVPNQSNYSMATNIK